MSFSGNRHGHRSTDIKKHEKKKAQEKRRKRRVRIKLNCWKKRKLTPTPASAA